jgi:hypothetical protein
MVAEMQKLSSLALFEVGLLGVAGFLPLFFEFFIK